MNPEKLTEIAVLWRLNKLEPLAHDASTRRYFRCDEGILMVDCEDGHEERIKNFKSISERLRKQNLRAPEIYQFDEVLGFALIEDFGGLPLKNTPTSDNLNKAYELLKDLRQVDPDGLRIYSEDIYQEELSRLWRFYLSKIEINDDELASIAQPILQELAAQSEIFVHLDYHGENLMILDNGEIGLLDIQDARQGHKLYDLASYFDGIRMPMPAKLHAHALENLTTAERRDFHILSAQRLIKVIGIFARLHSEGQHKYGLMLPAIFENLDQHFQYDQLKLWQEWFNDVVPRPSQETLKKLEN